jgi:hypothetical protein
VIHRYRSRAIDLIGHRAIASSYGYFSRRNTEQKHIQSCQLNLRAALSDRR